MKSLLLCAAVLAACTCAVAVDCPTGETGFNDCSRTIIGGVVINTAMSGVRALSEEISTSATYAGDKLTLTVAITIDLGTPNSVTTSMMQGDELYWYVCAPWIQGASDAVYCMKAQSNYLTKSWQTLDVNVFKNNILPAGSFTDYETHNATKKVATLGMATPGYDIKHVLVDGNFKLIKDQCVINDKKVTAVMTHEFAWNYDAYLKKAKQPGAVSSVKGRAGGYWASKAFGKNMPMTNSKDIDFRFTPTSMELSGANSLTGFVAAVIAIIATIL